MTLLIAAPLKSGHFNEISLGNIIEILPFISGHTLFYQQRYAKIIQKSLKANFHDSMYVHICYVLIYVHICYILICINVLIQLNSK